jgi:hypothetical protein
MWQQGAESCTANWDLPARVVDFIHRFSIEASLRQSSGEVEF